MQRSHKNSVSADSILRLEKTLKAGQRKFPPHQVYKDDDDDCHGNDDNFSG